MKVGAAVVATMLLTTGCGSAASSSTPSPTPSSSNPPAAAVTPPTTIAPVEAESRATVDPTRRPVAADTAAGLAAQIVEAERAVRDPTTSPDDLRFWGHTQQVVYAALAARPRWDDRVRRYVPAGLHLALDANVAARRASAGLLPTEPATDLPAWRIITPEPAADLLTHYRAAEDATGIEWEYLAAINLTETRMGRIIGDSTAGAQGPMQFLPTTWAEPGIGEGDIYDPADAIAAAARYLVRRGGPDDMAAALYGYNNSDSYVQAIEQYARVLRDDPQAYDGFHQWQVYYATAEGVIWLEEGYEQAEPAPVLDYLAEHPEAGPHG